jgi:glycosyltransferase involved in cell wall biosynthesis
MPRVSVVIASYNHERYIAETIRSVLNQTYQDFEIVITDDGSQDGTVEEIRKIADPRITVTAFGRNEGACIAFNISIAKSRGEYIAVLNSDDAFMSEKLEKQVQFLDEHPEIGAVFSRAIIIDEDGNDIDDRENQYSYISTHTNKTRHEWLRHYFYLGSSPCHPSILIRKECYETVGTYNPRLAQIPDVDFWVRLCMKYDIHIIPEKLVKFRFRDLAANQSGDKPEKGIRMHYERRHVVENYLRLTTKEEFVKVFPEAEQLFSPLSDELIPFYLAKFALGVDSPAYRLFALDTMYNLLEEEDTRSELKQRYGFSYRDFIEYSATYDIFNRYGSSYSVLFVDTGSGFREQEKAIRLVNTRLDIFSVKFDVSGFKNIKSLRWDPIRNLYCTLSIDRLSYTDRSGGVFLVDAKSLATNGRKKRDGTIVFVTIAPHVFLPIAGEIVSVEISGTWVLMDRAAYLMNSRSWKLTEPMRKTMRSLKSFLGYLRNHVRGNNMNGRTSGRSGLPDE